jgi:hypothetical protein
VVLGAKPKSEPFGGDGNRTKLGADASGDSLLGGLFLARRRVWMRFSSRFWGPVFLARRRVWMRLERRFSSSFMGVLGVFKASLQPDQLQVCWSFA